MPDRQTSRAEVVQIDTPDQSTFQQVIRNVYGPGMDLQFGGPPARAVWRATVMNLGAVTLARGVVAATTKLRGATDCYVLLLPQLGTAEGLSDHRNFTVGPGRGGTLFSPDLRVDLSGVTDLQTLTARLDPRFVVAQLEAITGISVAAPPRFAPFVATDGGPGADIERYLRFLAGEAARSESVLTAPLVAVGLRESLVRALLIGHPHSLSHLLAAPAPAAGSRQVRLVEEYIEAHAAEPISLVDLAALASTSARSLQMAFRAARGQTMTQFLREQRLGLARRRLLAPSPAATVTSIATDSGFAHLGRFSGAYLRRYGESPSATLRRGQLVTAGASALSAVVATEE